MTTAIVAESDLSLASLDRLAAALRDALARGGAVRLDLAAVAVPDLALLQLVEAARRQAARDGNDLALAAPADGPLARALERSGFTAGFDAADHDFWFHGDPPR
ncbi:STAS domain-containing protein [Sphingomonas sp. RHCKR7]|uniref:STAS domain-containing protein n=1 Tax=Sphingomonas folli TaxID=2862497 RepID=UPI001CA5B14C|nr:STAS domain-containing protein [Sphingomonas folli]MBW6527459.1 STAS domain-containing protein [Sphingomonas folli]